MNLLSLQTVRCRFLSTLLATVMTLFWVSGAVAQEVDEGVVRGYVRQLADREATKREDAEKKLIELGPKALEFLPAVDANTRGELKSRLQRIREQLEKVQVEETLKATRLKLNGEMLLSDVLDAIKDQTGNQVIDYRNRIDGQSTDFEIDLDIDDAFWPAFDKIADTAGITVYPYVESGSFAIVASPNTGQKRFGSAVYEGLFRIEATSVSCQSDLRDPNGDRMRLGLELIWEPRVIPIQIRQDLVDVEAVADNGEVLNVLQRGTSQIPIRAGVASLDLFLPFELPSRAAQSIASLKGKFVALVPGGDVDFVFADLVDYKESEQKRGGITVAIDDIRKNGGLPQISIRIRYEQAGEAMQSHLDWVENNKIELIGPDGKSAGEPGGYERYLERDGEVGFRYVFDAEYEKDLTGWKLLYRTPAGVAEVPVEYELKDIRLP